MTVNLQNQPKGKAIDVRAAYVAPDDFLLVSSDFSQMEFRVMANLASEDYLINQFKAGTDMHTATARLMLNIPNDKEVTKEERKMGKIFNFGVSYGMSFVTIAKDAKISEEEAQQKYEYFFSKVPKLKALINTCQTFCEQNKYITTLFGRKRNLDYTKLPAKPPRIRQDYIKKAFNTRIQGTAADLFKMALIRLEDRLLSKYPDDIKLMAVVHDEAVFYVRKSRFEEFAPQILNCMRIPAPDTWAPFDADLAYGPNWSEDNMQDYKAPDDYKFDEFTGWQNTLPAHISSHLENPEYRVIW